MRAVLRVRVQHWISSAYTSIRYVALLSSSDPSCDWEMLVWMGLVCFVRRLDESMKE